MTGAVCTRLDVLEVGTFILSDTVAKPDGATLVGCKATAVVDSTIVAVKALGDASCTYWSGPAVLASVQPLFVLAPLMRKSEATVPLLVAVKVPGVGSTPVEPRFTVPYATLSGVTETVTKPGVTVALTVASDCA